jgi:hypothetical protein
MLQIPHAAIADMLLAATLMASGEATYRPLARVRDLCGAVGGNGPDSSNVARLLHAAPQSRKFNAGSKAAWSGRTTQRLRGSSTPGCGRSVSSSQ